MPASPSERSYYDSRYRLLLDSDLRLRCFDGRVNNTLKEVLDFSYELLGPLAGKRILDYAGGDGWNAALLAWRGGEVITFDLSPVAGRVARKRAEVNGVAERVAAVACDATRLPFGGGSIDLAHGCGVLHHLDDVAGAGRELRRVLAPGGRAVFIEPLGHNPLLEFARRALPYRGKRRSPGEAPLRYGDVEVLRAFFPELCATEKKLLGMLDRVIDSTRATRFLDRVDGWLLSRFPLLRRWCRLIVVELPRPPED